ncbi:Hypothetical predicted protein, partial [Paramuricea clavata]
MISIYKREKLKKLSEYTDTPDGAISLFEGLSLVDYIVAGETVCISEHRQPCKNCLGLLNVAKVVANEGHWKMKDAFKCLAEHVQPCEACPEKITNNVNETCNKPKMCSDPINMANYSSQHAKRKFLQMPLAAINVKSGSKESETFLVDKHANLTLLRSLLQKLLEKRQDNNLLNMETFKALIESCSSDAEREKLRFTVAETTGLSQRQLTNQFGISNCINRKARIEHALARALEIRKNVEKLSQIREQAVLMSLGFDVAEIDSDDSSSESESDPDVEVENDLILQQSLTKRVPTHQYCENEEELDTATALFQKCKTQKLLSCLKDNHFNWISF